MEIYQAFFMKLAPKWGFLHGIPPSDETKTCVQARRIVEGLAPGEWFDKKYKAKSAMSP